MISQDVFSLAKSSSSINSYIKENLFDPWIDTPFEGYRFLDNKQKGEFGERYVSELFKLQGFTVESPPSSTAGYDRIINGIKTEIKFSVSHTNIKKKCIRKDVFTMNHVSVGKEWDRLIFLGINENVDDVRFGFFDKNDFIECLATENFFSYQQGGKKAKNDDFMIASKKLISLINSNFFKNISEW